KLPEKGKWNGETITETPGQQHVPRASGPIQKLKSDWSITKAFSGLASRINNKMHGQSDRARGISQAIKENNVDAFKEHLNNMRNEVQVYNQNRMEKHNGYNLKSWQEPVQQLSVNNKPLLFALAESGSPEMIEALCTADKIAPRTFYALSFYEDSSLQEYIADRLHEGELNEAGWWCYSGSPLNYSLASGNYEAAESFLKHGGNLHGCDDALKKSPQEVRDRLEAVLMDRKIHLLNKMKEKKEIIKLMEAEQWLPEIVAKLDDAKLDDAKRAKFQDIINRLERAGDPKTVFSKERLELTSLGALAEQNTRDRRLLGSLSK
ncbi:MAG: hypothetical protein ACPG5T_10985, partial [Endozoicomonas sp.]